MEGNSEAQHQSRCKKREVKFRKRDPLFWSNLIKNIDPDLDKVSTLAIVEAKYKELYDQQRQSRVKSEALETLNASLKKTNDHCQCELAKAVLARSRLEDLSRELQKRNKMICGESLSRVKESEDKRIELHGKFTGKLKEITGMMEANEANSEKLLGDNAKMAENLIELHKQLQNREEDIVKVTKQLSLEREYHATLVQKMGLEADLQKASQEKEVLALKDELKKSGMTGESMLETIKQLNEHVHVYETQYKDFEARLAENNVALQGFRDRGLESNKQIVTSQKEAMLLQSQLRETASTLSTVRGEKQKLSTELELVRKKMEKLQCLCRQLQADRSAYLKILNERGVNVKSNYELKPADDQLQHLGDIVETVDSHSVDPVEEPPGQMVQNLDEVHESAAEVECT